jgi:hypothetical protein
VPRHDALAVRIDKERVIVRQVASDSKGPEILAGPQVDKMVALSRPLRTNVMVAQEIK